MVIMYPFHVPNNIICLCVSPLSFHIEILLYQHGQSALDTSRTLFLLASTQGTSCRLVMNHLIYVSICSLSRQVWMLIFHIINFKKIIIIHGYRGPGFFLIKTNPGLLFLLKVWSCVFISNFHHSPPPPPKGYKIVSLIINSDFLFKINLIYKTTDICSIFNTD